jgi:two-component system sensor histidine kinase KdpD
MTETHRDSGPVHPQPSPGDDGTTSAPWSRYGWAVAACAATTIIATALLPYLDLANIVLLFLLPVVVVALKCGRGPAVLAAFLSVALFDFFCVPPRLSFAVSDAQYLLTFLVMLAVALVIGQLTAGLRYQARVAAQREERAHALYGFARELSDLLRTEQVVDATVRIVAQTFHAQVAVLLPDDEQRLAVRSRAAVPPGLDLRIAQLAFGESRHPDAQTLADDDLLYLPLPAPMRTRGVLAIKPEHRRMLLAPERKRQLDTFAALAAGALERVHYVEVAQQALIRMESERLRNSLLSALSHDLRTPLAALIGLAESLTLTRPALSGAQLDTAQAITDEARRMSALVNNLLDMARIQSGEVKLLLHWMPFEEVVGSALNAARAALAHHPVEVAVPRDLPLVQLDATLIERVLCNLLENAAKYTPGGTPVTLAAEVSGPVLVVTVRDAGPGIPAGQEETIFEKFTRGARESATPGLGLGLAISRAIVEAHHGRIQAANDPAGGARFRPGPGERNTWRLTHRPRCWSRTSARSGASSARRWKPRDGRWSRPKR